MSKISQNTSAWNTLLTLALLSVLWGTSTASWAQQQPYQTFDLTDEQYALLQADPYVPAEQIESLNKDYPIPLIALSVSASRSQTNTDQFKFVTTYKSMGISLQEHTYLLEAPTIKSLDFTAAIKKKCQESPQTLIDSLVINGALGFNLSW